jgi:uncharacterized protein YodC (DUF2158 family)
MDEIIVGDVLTLRSGGPPMTVTEVRENPKNSDDRLVCCVWFLDDDGEQGKLFDGEFPEAAVCRQSDMVPICCPKCGAEFKADPLGKEQFYATTDCPECGVLLIRLP